METKSFKKCPYCGEEILSVAIKCKHCRQWLSERPSTTTDHQNKPTLQSPESADQGGAIFLFKPAWLIAIVGVLLVLIIAGLYYLGGSSSSAENNSRCVDRGVEQDRRYSDDGKNLETLKILKTVDLRAPGSVTIQSMTGNKNDTTVVKIWVAKNSKNSISVSPTNSEPAGRYFFTSPSGYMYNPSQQKPIVFERTFECEGPYYLYVFDISSPKTITVERK